MQVDGIFARPDLPPNCQPSTEDNAQATSYLSSLVDKELGIHITDTRIFVGRMKCTDRERNIVLSNTFEYRQPPGKSEPVAMAHMLKRFVGLVVVPGEHITKVELTP